MCDSGEIISTVREVFSLTVETDRSPPRYTMYYYVAASPSRNLVYFHLTLLRVKPGAHDASFLAGRGGVLAAMRAAKRENDSKAGSPAAVRDFEDRTGAIFPACFLAG